MEEIRQVPKNIHDKREKVDVYIEKMIIPWLFKVVKEWSYVADRLRM